MISLTDFFVLIAPPNTQLWWRYGYIGPLLWHSPYTHDVVAPLFSKEDLFGPLARRLFRPNARLWHRIDSFRERHFAGHRVVGIEMSGGRAVLATMLAAIQADIDNARGDWDGYRLTDGPSDDKQHNLDEGGGIAR